MESLGVCDDCVYNAQCKEEYDKKNIPPGSAMMRDALTYIQRLEVAQLPRWISIGEKMPEVSDIALVIANGKPHPNVTLHNAILIASYWGKGGWIADGFEGWDTWQVTYWMPLREPPKGGMHESVFAVGLFPAGYGDFKPDKTRF